jgi:hypothetical protein
MHYAPIFIVGIGRSGTTLIRQMINSHSKIAIPYESHFITKYIKSISTYGDLNDDSNLTKLLSDITSEDILNDWDFKLTVDEFFEKIEERNLSSIFNVFFSCYAQHHGKCIWGDKSDYLDRMFEIKQLFPDAKFIHIIRDGRDVANSVMKMTWGPSSIGSAANWWAEGVRLGYSMGRMLDNNHYIEVRYEDLVLEAQPTLQKLCDFIGVDYEEKMLDFYKDSKKHIPQRLLNQHYNADIPPNTQRVFSWKNELSKLDNDVFQSIAGDVLSEFDYSIVPSSIPSILVKIRKLILLIKG